MLRNSIGNASDCKTAKYGKLSPSTNQSDARIGMQCNSYNSNSPMKLFELSGFRVAAVFMEKVNHEIDQSTNLIDLTGFRVILVRVFRDQLSRRTADPFHVQKTKKEQLVTT